MRLFTFHVSPYPKKITWIAPISLLTLLFSYSATNLQSLVNLTMYSAAMCNYFVPSALIFVVLILVLTTEKTLYLYAAAAVGFIAATMHEQSAAILAVLCLLLLIIGPQRWHIIHRSAAVLIVVAGIIEMFMAPGLQNKLSRVAAAAPEAPVSLPRRLVTTFYGFSVYFPLTAIMISAILVIYLIYYIRSSLHPHWGIILLVSLSFTTLLWSLCRVLLFLDSPASSQALTGLFCMLMMIVWVVVPLLSSEKSVRFGSVIFLCAASSMAIPAAAGLGAVRVFNFPVIFSWCLKSGLCIFS